MNLNLESKNHLIAYIKSIKYFLKHKTIWFYDVVDSCGNKVLCSSAFFPKYFIPKLGRIIYFNRDYKQIDYNYDE